MTNRISQVTLALLAMGVVGTASAGTMGNPVAVPAGINLIAPDSTGMWSFGVEGLWAIDNNQSFQYASVDSGSGTSFSNKNKSVKGDNDWGIAANINYMFAGNSRDVNLQYTGVFLNDSDSVNSVNAVDGVFGLGGNFDRAKGSAEQDLNRVDLTFGQLIRIGDRVDLHPFGGVSYMNLESTNKASYYNLNAAGVYVVDETLKNNSSYWGVGPSTGIDAAVHLGDGFSIVGRAGAALFIGDMDSSFVYRQTTVAQLDTVFDDKNDQTVQVVPELDARLGIDYMYAFNPNTSMNIQVGYEVANYFNAIQQDAVDEILVNTTNNTTNFSYYGPYLRLQLNLA